MKQKQILKLSIFFLTILALILVSSMIWADTGSTIPQRNEIEDKYKWKTEDIYPDQAAWEKDYEFLKENIGKLEQYKGRLADSPQTLLECLKLNETLGIIQGNLYVYAGLKLSEDGRKSEFQELTGRISNLSSQFGAAASFIEPELLSIPGDKITSMFKNSLELGEYQFYLEQLLRSKEHILSEKEEAILAATSPMAATALEVFQQMTASDLKLGTIIDDDGNELELTFGRYYAILEEASREVRKAASDTVQAQYMKYINSLAANLGGQLKNDYFYAKVRAYDNSLDASLDGYNVPTEVYHNLIKAVNDNIETLHKYSKLRKKILGVDTLFSYDMYVPLGPKSTRKYTYEEAIELINNGLQPLGQNYLDEMNNGLASGWVDVYETEGKETGAYQWGTYTSHPYIMLNFAGRLEDVFTLAHELGHAMNHFYVNRNEPYTYHNTSYFTAEVASTSNEAILMKYLLANTTDKNEKLALLNEYMNQILGTFFTQVMFAEFELAIHEQVDSGGATSVDFFRKTYRDIYQKYYGPEFVISKDKDIHGLKIYHFYRNYYVYQYATSYAAAQMISQRIVDGEEGALDSYFKFLSTGSSKYPIDVLKEAGVDLTQPEAVNRTIKLFGELIDEMERLLDES